MMLKWSSQPPTEPGWYWRRVLKETSPQMVLVEKKDDGLYFIHPWEVAHWKVDDFGYVGEWAGPIPEPTEDE